MVFPVFFDTCTLFGSYLCDTLLRLAAAEIFGPLWSADVLDELERNLVEHGINHEAVARRITAMRSAFPDAEVTEYQPLIDAMTCDAKDRDVLAAAVRARSEVLVTFNVRDFPDAATDPFDIQVVDPDSFLLDQLDLHPAAVRTALADQVTAYRRPPRQLPELLERLAASGVQNFAAAAAHL